MPDYHISENAAAGIGICVLIVLIAIAVTIFIFCCNELRILCYKHCYLFAPYFPVPIRLFYVSALCTGSHTYHKSGSCETISHADGANPYYDQR